MGLFHDIIQKERIPKLEWHISRIQEAFYKVNVGQPVRAQGCKIVALGSDFGTSHN